MHDRARDYGEANMSSPEPDMPPEEARALVAETMDMLQKHRASCIERMQHHRKMADFFEKEHDVIARFLSTDMMSSDKPMPAPKQQAF